MIQEPIDVLKLHPIRKTKKQKEAFAEDMLTYADELGYAAQVETSKRGTRNIVIGQLEKAKYLITAHYDTPASIGLPNFITPNNPITFFAFQIGLVLILLAVSVGAAVAAYFLSNNERVGYLTWYVVYFGILMLMLKGPANRNNANDNTSGVVTVLELLSAVPDTVKDKVCFVLFDMEEAGLVGSAQFRKQHKAVTEKQIVLNLDCVGDGDVIQFTPVKKARKDGALLKNLETICKVSGKKEIRLRSKGFYGGSSDHKNFPLGVAVMAFRYHKGIGLYCGRIHTWRDTVLDTENVAVLKDALISFLETSENSANAQCNI